MRREPSTIPMILAMLVASAGVHVLLWPVGDQVLALTWDSPPLPPLGGVMEVALLGDEPDDPESTETPPKIPGQLVQVDRVPDERPPLRDTPLVSEFDSRVDKQSKAPNRRQQLGERPQQVGDAPDADPRATESPERVDPSTRPELFSLGPERMADGEGPAVDPALLPQDAAGKHASEAGATAPRPRVGLRGTPEALRRTFGGPGTYDGLRDVEEGEQNLLNTRRFKFASFFNRMRDAIAQYWDPNEVMQAVDPDGRVYGRRTRRTTLHIQLTNKGAVHRARLVGPSGVQELDEEAIRSVNQAAPFVNPPPQMLDPKTGFIEVDFAFILAEDGKGTRIHRYVR